MHKGRRCPRFPETFLTITSHVDTFAPRRLGLGLNLFNGGNPIIYTPSSFSDEGVVDVDALTITWVGKCEYAAPDDTSFEMQLTFNADRGENDILVAMITPDGELLVVCETNYYWEAWNDTAVAAIVKWTGNGVVHLDGGNLTSPAKPWY